jgi:hypothetical protein
VCGDVFHSGKQTSFGWGSHPAVVYRQGFRQLWNGELGGIVGSPRGVLTAGRSAGGGGLLLVVEGVILVYAAKASRSP